MSSVTPIPQQTAVELYGDIPWDNTYTNIRLFDSDEQRRNYLATKRVNQNPMTTLSVVKPGQAIRVEGRINDFLQVTYLSFINYNMTAFPDRNQRQFFAFVTSVDYVNVNTVEITYEIDWVQTYLFDFSLEACTVLREHVNSDKIGEWKTDEHMDFDGYSINQQISITQVPAVMIYITGQDKYNMLRLIPNRFGVDSIASGCSTKGTYLNNINFLNIMISDYMYENINDIVGICMCTEDMLQQTGEDEAYNTVSFQKTTSVSRSLQFYNPAGGNGYIPHNNKLYSYPFCCIQIASYEGDAAIIKWEDFKNPTIAEFSLSGYPVPKPLLMLEPLNFMNLQHQNNYRVFYSNFPMVPFKNDTFTSWYATYKEQKGWELIGSAITTGVGIATGQWGIAAASAVSALEDYQGWTGESYEAKIHQLSSGGIRGSVSGSGMPYFERQIGFRVTGMTIKADDARRIDKFFDRYGYKMNNTVKIPNIRGRKYVNYVQTQNSQISGAVPDSMRVILENAMNRGVSFWHVDTIGMDLPDNPIVNVSRETLEE